MRIAGTKLLSIGIPVLMIDANNKTTKDICNIIDRAILQLMNEEPDENT